MLGLRITTHSASISLGIALHADTANWQSRVVAAGGSISSSILTATDTLIKWAYANGLRDNANVNHLIRFWLPLCTETFNGLFIPIWHPTANAVCANNNFVSADYTRQTGLQGANTKYIESGVTTTHLGASSTSAYLAADSNTNVAENSTAMGCVADNSPNPSWISALWCKYSDGVSYFEHPSQNSASASIASSVGFFYALRNGNTSYLYQNSTLLDTFTITPASTIPANIEYALFANNSVTSGIINFNIARAYQGFFLGAGNITQGQATSFATQYLAWKAIVRA